MVRIPIKGRWRHAQGLWRRGDVRCRQRLMSAQLGKQLAHLLYVLCCVTECTEDEDTKIKRVFAFKDLIA